MGEGTKNRILTSLGNLLINGYDTLQKSTPGADKTAAGDTSA